MAKINEAEYEAAYVALKTAGLLKNTLNNGMITGVDHDAFDTANKTMANNVVISATTDVFDPRNNLLSVTNIQGSSMNYATQIAKLCALFTLTSGLTYNFDLAKLGTFGGTAGSTQTYVSFVQGLAKIQAAYQDNVLSDNILVGFIGLLPLMDDTTASIVFTGLDSAAVTPTGILLTGNEKLVVNSISAVYSGATAGNSVYTIDVSIVAI